MREAEWLLEAVTGQSSWEIKTFRQKISDEHVDRLANLLERRRSGEPLQYITGIAGFRGIQLHVGPGVFIPRPETEIVAEVAMARLPEDGLVIDLCTGSGAIALSIAAERADARIIATEQGPEAFQWAEKNRVALLADVQILEGDLFAPLDPTLKGTVDVVVSNPPYVAKAEARRLPPEVIDHEPHNALFAGGDGLDVIRRIARESGAWLKVGGWVVIEMGETQADAVRTVFQRESFSEVTIDRDLARRDRVASARWPGERTAS
jgi:release factor glutamine methyltransferase